MGWTGLGGPREGWRALGGWDEDAFTFAVEAAREACGDGQSIAKVIFASTSAPFFERSQASLLVDALALPKSARSFDVSGSRRCAVSALMDALEGRGRVLVCSGERRATRPGSSAQLNFGDGGAAALVSDGGGARYLGGASLSHDFLDMYASREHPTPYLAEERFVRDAATREIMVPTILAACRTSGVNPASIALAACAEPSAGCFKRAADDAGITATNTSDVVMLAAGDLGASHAVFSFALAMERAKTGDIILLSSFGSGCDALLFEKIGPVAGTGSAEQLLRSGRALESYPRFLSLTGSLDIEWGPRAELDQKIQASVVGRYGRDMLGMVGGRDKRGNVQFPKSVMPVNPDADGPEELENVRLAEMAARVVSITDDRVNFTPDPPFKFGLVQFDNGARLMMEFVDSDPVSLNVGDPVRMRLRIKAIDRRRGLRSYFWKAAPLQRPSLES
jgi:3-hydroxy-3-methylglutaryl CoA synthase/uncharacterized OB-fold protein